MSIRFERNDKQINKRIRDGVAGNEEAAARHLSGAIKKKMRGGGRSGIEYRIPGGKSATYTASAPGEPPAVATGDLLRSYQAVKKPGGGGAWLVGTPLKYARYLEVGTKNMRPRPHFKVTAEQELPTIVDILRRRVA